MTILKFTGGSLGLDSFKLKCDLSQASSPVMADYCQGEGWQHTQYQCADCRHTVSGMEDIAHSLLSVALEMEKDEIETECEEVESDEVVAMVDVLKGAGVLFTGNDVTDTAKEWISNGFDADSASDWIEAGFWEPKVAAQCRDAGVDADDYAKAAEDLSKQAYGGGNPFTYTDGCPIYSCCNGDTDVSVLIDEAKCIASPRDHKITE